MEKHKLEPPRIPPNAVVDANVAGDYVGGKDFYSELDQLTGNFVDLQLRNPDKENQQRSPVKIQKQELQDGYKTMSALRHLNREERELIHKPEVKRMATMGQLCRTEFSDTCKILLTTTLNCSNTFMLDVVA